MAIEREAENFALGEGWSLLKRTSESTWLSGGAGKFVKLAIGTFLGCAAASKASGRCDPSAVSRALQASFFWALTYPLVDDVLDSGSSNSKDRARLERSLRQALRDYGPSSSSGHDLAPPIAVAMRRLLALPDTNRKRVADAIESVLVAHVEGAKPRLGLDVDAGDAFVWLALEKSLLVRTATSEVCGFEVTWDEYRVMAPVAYFNQLGDDIWDAAEDLRDGAINPVTLWLTGARAENPYQTYLDFGAWIADESADSGTARAVALAIVHTFSLALSDGSASEAVLASVLGGAFRSELLTAVPHIDPDSMLFEFDRLSVREYLSRGDAQ